MSSKPWRALVVGCGKIAGGYNTGPDDPMILTHALAYLRDRRFQLAACVEPDEQVRARFMAKWNVPQGYATLDAALDAEPFDIVSVCTPTGTHISNLTRLLDVDVKAVFAEKPLDGAVSKAREVGRRFASKGIPVAVNFTRRFDREMHDLRDAIRTERYGAMQSVTGWYSGGLLNNGSHLLDLVIFLTDRHPSIVEIDGAASRSAADRPATFVLDLAGAPFHVIGCADARMTRFEVEIACADAIVTIEDGGLAIRSRMASASSVFPGEVVPARGEWTPTQYGSAMLSALHELIGWHEGSRLSSDIASACEAIEIAVSINSQVVGR